jgi:hypothetical protein
MDTPISRIRGKTLDSGMDEKNYVFLKAYALASILNPVGHILNLTISYFTRIHM